MSIGLIADFPGPTVALFTNIFFYNRTDDNKLLSFCLLVVSQIYSAMSYYRYMPSVSCLPVRKQKTRKQFPVLAVNKDEKYAEMGMDVHKS